MGVSCPGRGRRGGLGRTSLTARTAAGCWGGVQEQIAHRIKLDFPDDDSMGISHEAIYQALFIESRGALKRELILCLRTGRALRMPRARSKRVPWAHVTADVLISERPAEAEDRGHPGPPRGGPHHRLQPVSDRHRRRADHRIHHARSPAPRGRLAGTAHREERPGAVRLRGAVR